MIRKLQKADINNVVAIWLATNLKAHYFISAQYWKINFELVKERLSQAEVYVYEKEKKCRVYRAKLLLNVYQRNTRAIHFYPKDGHEMNGTNQNLRWKYGIK